MLRGRGGGVWCGGGGYHCNRSVPGDFCIIETMTFFFIENSGDEVGKCFTYSGACFNNQIAFFFQGTSNQAGHPELLLSIFKVIEVLRGVLSTKMLSIDSFIERFILLTRKRDVC